MKAWTIWPSLIPWLSILKICARAGLQKWHWPEDIMQLTFSVVAPHWQIICVPTRLTSSLSSCDSDCARAAAARMRKRKLRFNLYILFGYANYFGARIRTRDLTWNEADHRPEN